MATTADGRLMYKRDLYFRRLNGDGRPMRIDYILTYDASSDPKKAKRRAAFERHLRKTGVVLEYEKTESEVTFVKLHAPWETLIAYAEMMKMKMPIKKYDIGQEDAESWLGRLLSKFASVISFDSRFYREEDSYFTSHFRVDKLHMFIVKDKMTFFSYAERNRIMWEILQRTRWDDHSKGFGIRRLINLGFYDDAYPLHEGPFDLSLVDINSGNINDRFMLRNMWASFGCWYRLQPLDLVRRYFGEKIAIYFTWLGLYTQMLIPVSIIGFCVFFYGAFSYRGDFPSEEICRGAAGSTRMCPLCDNRCTYWELRESCLTARFTHILDNEATVAFAVVMAFWGTIFLELWKRKEFELQYDWDVAEFEAEEIIRPEFEARCNTYRVNPITGEQEPFIPLLSRVPRYAASILSVFFLLLLVLAFVLGVIVYRVVMSTIFGALGSQFRSFSKILTTSTAAVINLIVILLLNKVYSIIAVWLTNAENNRTETNYDDSLTVKMYCFKFVNMYSSVFYIAFVKGNATRRAASSTWPSSSSSSSAATRSSTTWWRSASR